jgi:hypothetical protein
MFWVPTHACLVDAITHNLFDTTLSSTATDLHALLDEERVVHTLSLVFEITGVFHLTGAILG